MSKALRVADGLMRATGGVRLLRSRLRGALTILMYHRVLPDDRAGACLMRNLVVSRECFERQARWLADRFSIVTMREGLERLDRGDRPARPMVALTFDDGHWDNYEFAAPVLEAVGARGTFFVVTGFVEGTPIWIDLAAWFHKRVSESGAGVLSADAERVLGGGELARSRLSSLDGWLSWLKTMDAVTRDRVLREVGATEAPPGCHAMTRQQVIDLSARGHEIGAHTLSHPVLTSEHEGEAEREIRGSVEHVREWTGQSHVGFCYPNGAWSASVRRACERVGVAYGVGTRRHPNWAGGDRLVLGRRWIAPRSTSVNGRHSASMFAGEVLGVHDWVRDRMGRSRGPGMVGERSPGSWEGGTNGAPEAAGTVGPTPDGADLERVA